MRRRLRNNIYFGVFPMLILMLGLIAYIILVIKNSNVLVQRVSNEQYEALVLLSNVQGHLIFIRDRAETGEPIDGVLENLRKDMGVLETLGEKNALLNESLGHFQNRLVDMIRWIETFEDTDNLRSDVVDTLLLQVNDRLLLLSEVQSNLSEGIKNTSDSYRDFSQQTYYILAIGMTLAVFIALLISRKLSKDILNPIEELNQAIEKISEGEMNLDLTFKRKDEIGDFARAFARMVSQLQKYQQLTNRKLLRSTNALRNILEKTPDAMFVVRQDLRITFNNPQALKLLAASELKGTFPDELQKVIEQSFEENREIFSQKLEDAISFKVHSEERHFLVHTFPFEVFSPDLSELTEDVVDVMAVAVILQDVTLIHLSDRLKSNLVATVSHELKTPLTSARMSLYLLGEQQIGPLNEDQLELVETAKDDLNRQLATIQNLLDLSRIENDRNELIKKPFVLTDVVTESFHAHEIFAEGADVEMELDISSDELIEILGDGYRIKVVINNLVSNAIKYSGNGAKVTLRCFKKAGKAHVEVEDNGPGVDTEKIEMLFDPYQRGGTEITEISGSGLGLTIARDVINAHGGKIGCRSEINVGSCFFFELPILDSENRLKH